MAVTDNADAAGPVDRDDAPLAGIKVVEISMYVQGPVAGLVLASMGADVIKIEQVDRADIMRSMSGSYGVRYDEVGKAWQYAALNRGKRSLALDVTSARGKPVFHRLIAEADEFVTNLRRDALARFGADPETLHAINPTLVYARGGGFGLRGALAEDPCQDTVGMAYSGFMDVTSPNDEPNYPPGAMSDVLTGTSLASAVLAGLVRRIRTGRGDIVGTSQVQSLLWMQLMPVGLMSTTGQRMTRFSATDQPNPIFGVYPTSDGWIAIAAIHPAHWPPVAHTLGADHLLEDERFATFDKVLRNRVELAPLLAERFRTRTTREWWEALRAAGVWTSPVNKLGDLATDQHILDNEYLVTFADGCVGPPAPFDVGDWRGARGGAAEYGEHTDTILGELGYSDDEVLGLRLDRAIF